MTLPDPLELALTRLEQAVAKRMDAAAEATKAATEQAAARQDAAAEGASDDAPGVTEDLRRRLEASEAEVQRLTRALAVAEKRRADALAKLDAAVGQVDLFLAQPEVR